jgi:hypothetical protein
MASTTTINGGKDYENSKSHNEHALTKLLVPVKITVDVHMYLYVCVLGTIRTYVYTYTYVYMNL